jgi:hypothetical protein
MLGFLTLIKCVKIWEMEGFMENINLMMVIMGLGFSGIGFALNHICGLISQMDNRLNNRIDKLDEKLTDVDRRLCRMEGAFSRQDCCMLSNKSSEKVS